MWKRVLTIGLLVLGMAGCGPMLQPATNTSSGTSVPATSVAATPAVSRAATAPAATPTAPADRLYLAGGFASAAAAAGRSGWIILNASGPAQEQPIPAGVPAPDWCTVYTVAQANDATTVQAVDLATGHVMHRVTIAGTYVLPAGGSPLMPGGLSPNGQWLALQHLPTDTEQVAYARDGWWQSQLIVLPTSFARPPRQIDLKGNFSLDAVSDDGTSLYLIESVPDARDPNQYRVRLYDLTQSTLQPGAVVDKSGDNLMSGTRHAAVATPDGQWLFSLYVNAQTGPFIHALNLSHRYALCIDLPLTAQERLSNGALWSLTVAPDGKTLYAANGELGVVSAVSTDALQIVKTAHFAVAPAANSPRQVLARWAIPSAEAKGVTVGSAISPDGRTLYVLSAHGLFDLATAGLTLTSQTLAGWPLASVAVSADGRFLYLLREDSPAIYVVNASTGGIVRTLTASVIPFGILRVSSPAVS